MTTHPDPALICSAELARRLGIAERTLNTWRRERSPDGQRLRACIYRATARSTYWHVDRLRKAGFLPAAAPIASSAEAPVLEWQWRAAP